MGTLAEIQTQRPRMPPCLNEAAPRFQFDTSQGFVSLTDYCRKRLLLLFNPTEHEELCVQDLLECTGVYLSFTGHGQPVQHDQRHRGQSLVFLSYPQSRDHKCIDLISRPTKRS